MLTVEKSLVCTTFSCSMSCFRFWNSFHSVIIVFDLRYNSFQHGFQRKRNISLSNSIFLIRMITKVSFVFQEGGTHIKDIPKNLPSSKNIPTYVHYINQHVTSFCYANHYFRQSCSKCYTFCTSETFIFTAHSHYLSIKFIT